MDLGYVYEPDHTIGDPTGFTPVYRKGARLSHVWIQSLNTDVSKALPRSVDLSYLGDEMFQGHPDNWRHSTLDLVPIDAFVILHAIIGYDMAHAIEGDMKDRGLPVRRLAHRWDFGFGDQDEPVKAGKDWLAGYGLDKGGVIVVRPDQFIAAVIPNGGYREELVNDIVSMRM